MKIRNKRNGNEFTIPQWEYQKTVVDGGNVDLYEVLSDDAPFEVKTLNAIRAEKKIVKPIEDKPTKK